MLPSSLQINFVTGTCHSEHLVILCHLYRNFLMKQNTNC